jgi:diguanylate cyclase (GGDEF)-like protein
LTSRSPWCTLHSPHSGGGEIVTTTLDQATEDLVLVVDDEDSTRDALVGALASAGLRSAAAGSAAEALRLLPLHAPAVVVVDDQLPDSSGFDLALAIKERDPEMPVLLLTGLASLDRAIAAIGQLDAYLIKPVAAQTFLKAIRNALARRGLVAENKSLAERLQRLNAYQALYDPLTGLPNRALLDDRLGQAIASSRRTGSSLAVLFIDLDGFKVVNDLFGHHVGDQLLREMGNRLAETRRSSDTVARFGGDEFVVVCPDIRTSASACKIAEQLLAELARPVEVDGVEHRLTASVGIAVTSRGGPSQSAEALLRNADTAMYRAKEEGRAGWELFDDAMRDRVLERFEVERGLRGGMDNGDLSLAYQPVVDLRTGAVVGAEALLRWHRLGYGTVLPGSFLSIAEESGLVVPIGRWVLEEALTELQGWLRNADLPEGFRLWVNVSPQQLANPHFADLVGELMDAHGLPAGLLGVEIAEEALRDVGATIRVLQGLRAVGVAVNLDDFGAGQSNLGWLQELPITGLKIARRFVANLAGDGGAAMVSGLVGLARALGLSVVGEGVETEEQSEALRAMGCEQAQGYFFGYPGPPSQLWEPTVVGTGDVVDNDGAIDSDVVVPLFRP